MRSLWRPAGVSLLALVLCSLCSCGVTLFGHLSYAAEASDPLAHYRPFTTDVAGFSSGVNLPIHCSQDKINWTICGSVFPQGIPAWVSEKVPGILGLWAPDVSFFNGEYHVYYNGSTLHSQATVIGLVTNTTLDPADSNYKWVDRGLVLESKSGDDFNALDPSILVDTDRTVWLTYGSYFGGIKQRQVNPATGKLLASNPTRYDLANRPGVPHNPIEGASILHHGGYYYLFVSVDYCCEQDVAANNYKQAVGRSTSPHGPFVDENGTPMTNGGGTVLLQGDSNWGAPGGGTAYLDAANGDSLIIFHAHNLAKNGHPYQWLKPLQWENDWPVIGD